MEGQDGAAGRGKNLSLHYCERVAVAVAPSRPKRSAWLVYLPLQRTDRYRRPAGRRTGRMPAAGGLRSLWLHGAMWQLHEANPRLATGGHGRSAGHGCSHRLRLAGSGIADAARMAQFPMQVEIRRES